jgi:hypothetical protein
MGRLGGYPLLADNTHAWRLQTGAQPYSGQFRLLRGDADALLAAQEGGTKPVDLILGGMQFKNLVILGELPVERTDVAELGVADIRWFLNRVHIGPRWYNWRRQTGGRRWTQDGMTDISEVVDDIDYAYWSLYGGTAEWTAGGIVASVLADIKSSLPGINFDYGPVLSSVTTRAIPVDGFYLDGQADSCLQKAMDLAGCSYYAAPSGKLLCVDPFDRSENEVLARGYARERETPVPVFQQRAHLRPSKVVSYSTREIEVRFDGWDAVDSDDTTVDGAPGEDERVMRNVAPVPIEALTVGGIERSFGEIVLIDDLMTAGNLIKNAIVATTLGHTAVQKFWSAGSLIMAFAAGRWGAVQPDQRMYLIIAAIYKCYRTLWQIPRHWRDRTYQIRAVRATIRDPETGTRGEAKVWCDYFVLYPIDRMHQKMDEDDQTGTNKFALDSGSATLVSNDTWIASALTNMEAAEAEVNVVNSDQGLIAFDFETANHWGDLAQIYPCGVVDATIPRGTPEKYGPKSEELIELAASHKVAVVLSLVPAAPPGKASLLAYEVSPSSVAAKIGGSVGACNGPPLEVRLNPHVVTAMYAWADGRAEDIERAFGMHGGGGYIEDLLANENHIRDVTEAIAAREYLQMADRWEGTATYVGAIPIEPTGNLNFVEWIETAIRHTNRTRIGLEPVRVYADYTAFMSDEVRRQLGLMVTRHQSGGSGV